MNSFLSFTELFALISIYSIATTAFAYIVAHVLTKRLPWINQWKIFWLVLFLLCAATPLLELFPNLYTETTTSLLAEFYFDVIDTSNKHLPVIDSSRSIFNQLALISWVKIAWFILCSIGVACNLLQFSRRLLSVNKICQSAINIKHFKNNGESRVVKILARLARTKNLDVLVSRKQHSPFIVQWNKPILVLTETAIQSLSETELNLLVRHELIHLKRFDGITLLVTQFLLCLFWFNPFLRTIYGSLNWAIESSCDRQVLRKKKNLRRIYAQAMLKILRGSATEDANQAVAAFSSKSHRSITMRIKHIMKPSDVRVNRTIKSFGLSMFAIGFSTLAYSFYPVEGKSVSNQTATMENPVKQAKVTANFGANNKYHRLHKGIDLAAEMRAPVVAAESGKVITATTKLDKAKNYGTIIIIDHGNETHTVYSHLDSMNVSEGDVVEKGQLIGRVGITGKTSGPHVHFEVRKGGAQVDPRDYVEFN